ncbi:hypothetical protein LEP1GSC150_4517 [Leptospira interrogans serovar Copenhageni str. LT2050]|uniref:Uncharacterized protein n=1 Tax=Leptospira interrogans serovar Copenhageni str. LT2050 TaxID=1001598 RepID=M3GFI3_LEPIT|nr:hypothetical protein LEP1GSC150_4517 [Leptospira interrogans serovar Copenhageni str. LT2050]
MRFKTFLKKLKMNINLTIQNVVRSFFRFYISNRIRVLKDFFY